MTIGRRAAQRLLLLGTVLVLLLLGGAGPASAHAALRDSDPKDAAVLKTAPRHVTLSFTESVSLLDDSVRVVDPDNRPVKTGEAGRAKGRSDTVRVTLPTGLGEGTYTIAWRVVSADSHPVSGALIFSIGKPSATKAVVTTATEDPVTESLYNITRYIAYGGLALLIGVTVFTTVLGGFAGVLRRLLAGGWWALLASTVVLFFLRGPYERGTGVGNALDPKLLGETATGRPGLALLARLALLAGAFLLVRRSAAVRAEPAATAAGGEDGSSRTASGRAFAVTGLLLSVGLAFTWAAAEHASAGIQVPVAMTSSVLHLVAMAVWLGGLTALLAVLHRAPERLSAVTVTRFSRMAFASVIVLVVTGVYQSWRGLGSWDAFTSTPYGELLIAKLGAVLLLVAAAGLSRRWTMRWATAPDVSAPAEDSRVETRVPERVGAAGTEGPTVTTDDRDAPAPDTEAPTLPLDPGPHRTALRRSVLAEFMVALVVLVITTVLTGTLPGRAEAESASAVKSTAPDEVTSSTHTIPFDVGTPNGHGKIQIDLAPGTVGQNSIQAVLFGPDGGIATVPEVRLTFTLRAQDVGPIDAKLENRGGYWATDTLRLPLPGTWTMKVTIRTTEIDQVTVERKVKVS
jgi:copper transport protein